MEPAKAGGMIKSFYLPISANYFNPPQGLNSV